MSGCESVTSLGREPDQQRKAFEELYRATRYDLLAYVMRRSRNAEDAADILADTYLIAWQKLEKVPVGDEARPWLFGVARKLLLKGSTRRRVAHPLVERLAEELHRIQSTTSTEHQMTSVLRAMLGTLSETDREILTLTAWEGLTPKQIGKAMGLPANAVRVRLYRARRRLQRELGSNRDLELSFEPTQAVE